MTLRFSRKKDAGKPPPIAPPKAVAVESAPAAIPAPVKNAALAAARALSHKPTDAIRDQVLQRIEPTEAVRLSKGELSIFVHSLVQLVASERKVLLNQDEQDKLAVTIVDEMIGLGPIEPLLQDGTVSDILINGADMIYAERRGKLELTGLHFRNNAHVLHVAQRIASSIGRSVDEASPMLDARLADGSRVNVIIPPLSLNGPAISIRKFSRQMLGFDTFVTAGSVSPPMARALEIAARCRLNIIVCGGTGSGKTTMLNALSSMIDNKERIVTIEDAAELMLRQRHVVRLETRPANIEGKGSVKARELVINSLRMRPDRIVVGEVRGAEALDMLQAMNTGHDGSLTTIHANTPRDALYRLDTMVAMTNLNIPDRAIRQQVASAVDIIVQVSRQADGTRKVTAISEITGMEQEVITMQDIFLFEKTGFAASGKVSGRFRATGIRPKCNDRLAASGHPLPMDMFEHVQMVA
jgi:pilus assembly protein CpaF